MSATTARHSPHRPRETSWSSWRRRHPHRADEEQEVGRRDGPLLSHVCGQLRDDPGHLRRRLPREVEVARRLEQRFEPALLGALAQQRLGRRAAAVGAVERRRRRAAHRVQRRDGGRAAAIDDFGRDIADVARRAREAAAAPRRPHRPLAPAGRAAARRDERLRLGEERLRLGHHARRLRLVGAPVEEALDLVGVGAADEHHHARANSPATLGAATSRAARLQVRHGRQHGEGRGAHTAQKVAWRSSSSCEPPLAAALPPPRRRAVHARLSDPTCERARRTRSPPASKQMRQARPPRCPPELRAAAGDSRMGGARGARRCGEPTRWRGGRRGRPSLVEI